MAKEKSLFVTRDTSSNWLLFHRHVKYVILVGVSTHLKNIRQNGNLPQVGVKIK